MKMIGVMIRPYKLIELARLYNVSKPTLKKWLKPFMDKIGKARGHFFTATQVRKIIKSLGWPERLLMH